MTRRRRRGGIRGLLGEELEWWNVWLDGMKRAF